MRMTRSEPIGVVVVSKAHSSPLNLGNVFTLLVSLLLATPSVAEVSCNTPQYQCLEWSDGGVLNGVPLARHCARETGTQTCVDSAPANECTALAASLKCEQTSKSCIDYQHGECRQWRHEYACLNEDGDMSPAVLTETVFGDVQEEIVSTCQDLKNSPECELVETLTIEGEEIRNINRRDFFRNWWKRERVYSCIAPGERDTNCALLESNPTCKLKSDRCLARIDGICSNREYHYICGEEASELQTSCAPINVCVGDNCLGVEQEPSSDFGNSAAWLNILAEMQSDFRDQNSEEIEDIRFFRGTHMSCSKAPGRNCCKLSGVFSAVFGCPDSAELLADRRRAGASHYVGTTCQERVLGACVKRRYHYCTFNSKFGRVFIEEYRDQIDKDWGRRANNPDCTGVSVEDVANVDVDDMDFEEVYGDVMEDVALPVSEGIQDFFEQRFPDADTNAEQTYSGGQE